MCGPYPRLHRLSFPMSSMTETMLDTLRYHIERQSNQEAAMRALNWLKDNHTGLEPACDEMRASFICTDIETKNWNSRFAFNAIMIELSMSNRTLASSKYTELQYAS